MTETPLTRERFFEGFERMGPGSDTVSRALAHWANAALAERVLEVGCGHGATARVLAASGAREMVACDVSPLCAGVTHAALAGGTASVCAADIRALPFAPASFDAVVAEGCLYTVGLRHGVAALAPLVRSGGRLVFTHFGWTRTRVPGPMREFWEGGLPEKFVRAEAYMVMLEHAGFRAVHLEPFPRKEWESYYERVRGRLAELEPAHTDDESLAVLDGFRREVHAFEDGGMNFYAYFLIVGEKV